MTVLVVPIYDARKADTNFYDLVSNVEQLKRINCEIPTRSCAVVADWMRAGRLAPNATTNSSNTLA